VWLKIKLYVHVGGERLARDPTIGNPVAIAEKKGLLSRSSHTTGERDREGRKGYPQGLGREETRRCAQNGIGKSSLELKKRCDDQRKNLI